MKKIPSQFYMFVIVLCCYHWPWYLSFFDPDVDALLTVLLLQTGVIACNFLIKEKWCYLIILIEAAFMLFNVTLFLVPAMLVDYHAQIAVSAVIIELLIITISMQGAAIERSDSYSLHNFGGYIRTNRSVDFNYQGDSWALS